MASAYIPESLGSAQGDDDKIYFFFSEIGREFEFFEDTVVSRVARICKVTSGPGAHAGRLSPCLGSLGLSCFGGGVVPGPRSGG